MSERLFPLWLWDHHAAMRVTDEFVNCVAFIGFVNNREEFVPHGTGFCVLVAAKSLGVPHVVTALHVLDSIPGDKAWIRVIKKDGGFHLFALPKASFLTHSNHDKDRSYIDIAVSTMSHVLPDDPIVWVRESDFATEDAMASENIGLGDGVAIPGLLFNHFGETKNVPVVRFGDIAAMRHEPVPTDLGYMDAYLVEVRSIGGLSGSPVFVHMGSRPSTFTFDRTAPKQMHYLLGIVHGYYAVNYQGELVDVKTTQAVGEMNTGIAIVVPVSKLIETLMRPEVVQFREEWASEQLAKANSRT